MKRSVLYGIAGLAALFFTVSAWAEDSLAVVKDVKGRVELKVPGGVWTPAAAGTALGKDTVVSTGFNSQAVVALGESVLTIKPLTRLTLEDIARQEGSETVRLYLLAGRVRAEVRPPIGGETDFKVKSPSATASVRGTAFDFDSVNLDVSDGVVSLAGSSGGPAVQVAEGETSYIDEDGAATVAVLSDAASATPPSVPVGIDQTFFEASKPGTTVKSPVAAPGTIDVAAGW